ncbi:alpha-L-fucosidase [Microbacterium sp. CSI-V]|uniref:alpha-L-fucosidase n=1 Tax=Microbacterium sp. CSI-V TaxID=1933777 RepID=UPI00158DC933|nr:alpha-L-fucosidase [Microbacterium sp. CSI-V]
MRMLEVNHGLFVHYVPRLTVDPAGEAADMTGMAAFDVARFVADVQDFGVEYVRFTAWHFAMVPLYPSEVMRRWRGDHAVFPRDLLGELIVALRAVGIDVQLYTHPRDGHDFSPSDQTRTGWGVRGAHGQPDPSPSDFDRNRWNDFIAEAYSELLERYGSEVSAIYLDEGSERGDSEWVVDYERLRALVSRKAPEVVVIQNYYGNLYSADVADHEYGRWGELSSSDGETWPVFAFQSVSTVVGSTWWAARADPAFSVGYSVADLFRYLVLQISACRVGGGMAFAAGPFTPGGWEPGVAETLRAVAAIIAPIRASLHGVRAIDRWPTPDALCAAGIEWGVAVDTDAATYLHILTDTAGDALELPPSLDGRVPVSAADLRSGRAVPLSVGAGGEVRLEGIGDVRHDLDTVIELRF